MTKETTPGTLKPNHEGIELEEARAVAERLLFLSSGQEDVHSLAMKDAAGTIQSLVAHVEKLEAWQREGDGLMQTGSPMFALGQWWADRPWRQRLGS